MEEVIKLKNKNLSPNARKAFQKFKEELAEEMKIDMHEKADHITKMVNKDSDSKYTHLGRS